LSPSIDVLREHDQYVLVTEIIKALKALKLFAVVVLD